MRAPHKPAWHDALFAWDRRKKNQAEEPVKTRLLACTSVAVLITVIVISMRFACHKESESRPVQDRHRGKINDLASGEMSAARRQRIVANYGQLPLSFEANRGQTNAGVRFISHGSGYSLFLTDSEAVLSLRDPSRPKGPAATTIESSKSKINLSGAVLHLKLTGANPSPQVAGIEELIGKSNYFVGSNPTQWRTSVPTYAKVKEQSVYPGIDLIYHGNQRQLEYDFIVAPGAHPQAIRLSFRGTEGIDIDA